MSGHLRERPPGSGRWEIRWRAGGQTFTRTVKGNKTAAQRALRAALILVDRGEHVSPNRLTVGEFVAERISLWHSEGRIGGRTEETYQSLRKLIAVSLAETELQRLTTRQVEDWHGKLRVKGLSTSTIQKANGLLGRVLADGQRHGLLVRNPAREQRALRAATARVKVLTIDRIQPLLSALAETEFHVPATLTIYVGIRRGELLALGWSAIDLDKGELSIHRALDEINGVVTFTTPKTAAGNRRISLPVAAVEVLRTHKLRQMEQRMALGQGKPSGDTLVFPNPLTDEPQSPRAFTMRWQRLSRRIADGIRWHSLRHLHASLLVHYGIDLSTVAARLGHTQISTTLRTYTHAIAKDDRHAADALDQALGGRSR